MNEKLSVFYRAQEQSVESESDINSYSVFERVSEILGRRFDTIGVELWWSTIHPSLQIAPIEWLEKDPGAVLEYGLRFGQQGL